MTAIPVNPFCWSKSAKHDVTLTSLTADLLWPGSYFFLHKVWNCCPERYGKFHSEIPSTCQDYLRKKHRGGLCPPPSGARVNTIYENNPWSMLRLLRGETKLYLCLCSCDIPIFKHTSFTVFFLSNNLSYTQKNIYTMLVLIIWSFFI